MLPAPQRSLRGYGTPVLLSLLLGCTGSVSSVDRPRSDDSANGVDGGNGGNGGNANSGGSTATNPADVDDLLALTCAPDKAAFIAPTARLSVSEYRRTLTDLFAGMSLTALTMPTDTKIGGYDSLVAQQSASAVYVDAFHENAKVIATTALKSRDGWSTCVGNQDAKSCSNAIISNFGQRAMRRPLAADESARYQTFFDDSMKKYGADVATRMLVEAFLQSPSFLYRVELGDATTSAGGRETKLSTWELASRLSYLLLDSMPDKDLFAAAKDGTLTDVKVLEAQTRRLLGSAGARIAVSHFQDQWLELDKINKLSKVDTILPGFNDTTTTKLRTSTGKFVDHAFWDSGSLTALLTENKAFVDAAIGPLYGITNAPATLTLMDVPSAQRSGLLTQVGLLSALATDTRSSPVFRGVYVLDRLLCSAPPPPPANAVNAPQLPGTVVTTRDKFEIAHGGPSCKGCHNQIDGIGFAMEHYDAVGRWRDKENGANVNAKSKIEGVSSSIDGSFDGAIELSQKLSKSVKTRDCVALNWAAYAMGTVRDDVDACSLQPVVRQFADKQLDMRELLVALATSPSFRSIKTPTP